jgi:hypothetical protein
VKMWNSQKHAFVRSPNSIHQTNDSHVDIEDKQHKGEMTHSQDVSKAEHKIFKIDTSR